MLQLLESVNRFVWGIPALILILGVGLYLTVSTNFGQFRLFPMALRRLWDAFRKKDSEEGISSSQALCTALAATVGTGNLAGVAGAIAIGGPGSIFWMWICGIIGMITKYAEAILSVQYQTKNKSGETVGGPMYFIRFGMGSKWEWMAVLYCAFGVIAAFGVGNATQINAVVDGVNSVITAYGGSESILGNTIMGIGLAILVAMMLSGGAKKVAGIAEKLVPAASVMYIFLCVGVLFLRYRAIPTAFSSIFQGAFSPKAITGGAVGSVFTTLRVGAARGVFTNEAGMGTAAIAHGSAEVKDPYEQGLMGIVEVFLDTIVICTMTALVILCSGVEIYYGQDTGMALTSAAFSNVYGNWVSIPLGLSLCCFAIATILGWGVYGIRCGQYLFGEQFWKRFVIIQVVTVVCGALLNTGTVWLLAETVNGLMAIPNLLALAFLAPKVRLITKNIRSKADALLRTGN